MREMIKKKKVGFFSPLAILAILNMHHKAKAVLMIL